MEFGKQQYMGSGEQHPHHQQEQQQQRSRGAVQERSRAANVFSYSINAAAAVARGSVENKIEVEPARPHELNPTVFQEYYSSHLVPSLMETKPDPVLRFGGNPSPALRPVVMAGIDRSFGAAEEPDANLPSQIMSHPLYPRLVTAYMNCQKVGAPPELIVGLDEVSKHYRNSHSIETSPGFTSDPELDQFMEEYCSLLQTYHEELTRPFTEAMTFFQRIELQLDSLSKAVTVQSSHPGESEAVGDQNHVSSGEEDGSCGEIEYHDADPPAKEAKLKEKLLRKYGGYICTLKQEFMKRKKKGKLPKEARKKLLDWWYQHYKWPYPSEGEKAVLAESTGLDHKQINNWFINQRKRHWKPSDDMQYAMVGSPSTATHHHHHHPHPHHTNMNPFGDTTSSRTQTGVIPTDRF